jgi:hypothetical protein
MRRRFVRLLWLISAVAVLMLSACRSDPAPDLHELTLVGDLQERVAWFYGMPRPFDFAGATRLLEAPASGNVAATWFVPNALWIDGLPAYVDTPEAPVAAPVEVRRIPLTTDLQLKSARETRAVLYFDGSAWLQLGEFDPAGLNQRVTARPRLAGLRGLGELTSAEADALARRLESLGEPLIVSFLATPDVPRRAVDGVAEARATAVHVARGVEVDVGAFRPAPRDVVFEVIGAGQQAVGVDQTLYLLVRDAAELRAIWNRAYGNVLNPPAVPSVDFSRETLVAVFMGPKPTGGFGLAIRGVTFEGGDLFVALDLQEPRPGSMVTQSLTSPWLIARIPRGGFSAVWFRHPVDDRLIAVARAND